MLAWTSVSQKELRIPLLRRHRKLDTENWLIRQAASPKTRVSDTERESTVKDWLLKFVNNSILYDIPEEVRAVFLD
jgi:hypothetical protein